MISKNISDYVKVYDNSVDAELCDSTVSSLEKLDWRLHKFCDPGTKTYFVSEITADFRYTFVTWV